MAALRLIAVLPLIAGCGAPAPSPATAACARLPSGVELLSPEQMTAYCDLDPSALQRIRRGASRRRRRV